MKQLQYTDEYGFERLKVFPLDGATDVYVLAWSGGVTVVCTGFLDTGLVPRLAEALHIGAAFSDQQKTLRGLHELRETLDGTLTKWDAGEPTYNEFDHIDQLIRRGLTLPLAANTPDVYLDLLSVVNKYSAGTDTIEDYDHLLMVLNNYLEV